MKNNYKYIFIDNRDNVVKSFEVHVPINDTFCADSVHEMGERILEKHGYTDSTVIEARPLEKNLPEFDFVTQDTNVTISPVNERVNVTIEAVFEVSDSPLHLIFTREFKGIPEIDDMVIMAREEYEERKMTLPMKLLGVVLRDVQRTSVHAFEPRFVWARVHQIDDPEVEWWIPARTREDGDLDSVLGVLSNPDSERDIRYAEFEFQVMIEKNPM